MDPKPIASRPSFAFLLAGFAAVMAVLGFLSARDEGGGASLYLAEVGLPALIAAGLLWHGFALKR